MSSTHTPGSQLPEEIILYGGTGQAKVVRPIIESYGSRVVAVFDDTEGLAPTFQDVELYAGAKAIESWLEQNSQRLPQIGFSITIGNPHGAVRCSLQDLLVSLGLQAVTLIHPSAIVAEDAEISAGCQIMAGAVVAPQVKMARQCIINTRASVDHETVLEEGVEVAPGATLCGLILAREYAWICAGATVLPRIIIGKNAIVGAGAMVNQDVPDDTTVVGIPARPVSD